MSKMRFVIVGSGWRSLTYVQAAKALPDYFELCAMVCRTVEKAEKMSAEYDIYATINIEECKAMKPDFVVVAVNKASIAEVSMEWMKAGFTVLCETPAALQLSVLQELWRLHKEGRRLVVAEQYTRYPKYQALLSVLSRDIIGEPDCINISLAHEYHGASLMRAFLREAADTPFTVSAKTYTFPTVETLSRYERFTDGRMADKKRTVAAFTFADGKTAWYDFDSEQYRSPIRRNSLKIQGCRGEVKDDKIYYLDEQFEPCEGEFVVTEQILPRKNANGMLSYAAEKIELVEQGKKTELLYEPAFGKCSLTQDETAVALLMKRTAEYARAVSDAEGIMTDMEQELKNALQDSYMALLMGQAAESGRLISSEKQSWHI